MDQSIDHIKQQLSFGRGLLIALLIALPLYLFCTFGHDLWRPAEAREAGIAREMIENGNWVATYLNKHLFLEKPPLYTWALAGSLKLLGYHDWVVRIPVFLFTLGTLVLVYVLARQHLNIVGAQGALISLASMALFLEVNHGAMIDNGLVFFIVLAMLSFYRLSLPGRHAYLWGALFYISLGLTFLCKGGVGLGMVLVAITGFILTYRPRIRWRSYYPILGLGILVFIIGAWLGALWLKGGSTYFRVFFIENNLYRLQGKAGPLAEWYYYLPYLPAVALPWTLLVPAGIWVAWDQWRTALPGARRFWSYLVWWIGAMLVLLSLAGSKDNQYLLPLLPPLAIFCGAWIERTLAKQAYPSWCLILMWIFSGAVVALTALLPLAPIWFYKRFFLGSLLWALGLALIGFGALRALSQGRWQALWTYLALLAVAVGLTMGLFIEKLMNNMKSAKPLCAVIKKSLPADARLWGYDLNENTEGFLIFYDLRPQRLTTLTEAAALAEQPEPALLLLFSHNQRHEFGEQITRFQGWQILERVYIGGRYYWLFANRALLAKGLSIGPQLPAGD